MKQQATYRIQDFIFDLTEIPSSDVLVDIHSKHSEIAEITEMLSEKLVIPQHPKINLILKIAQQHKRTSDTNSLCISVGSMEWEYKSKIVNSPLFLIPVHTKFNRITRVLELTLWFENMLFNPFVRNELMRKFELDWEPSTTIDINKNLENFKEFCSKNELNYSFRSEILLANFHYHRFLILKELESINAIKTNKLVNKLLGEETGEYEEKINFKTNKIVNSDAEQNEVLEKIKTNNIVIIGPPGTGKSQTLTNIIGQSFDTNKLKIVVSEKRAALEVLVKKLNQYELNQYAFITSNQTRSSEFIYHLKKTWEFIETKKIVYNKSIEVSENLIQSLQLTMDKINSKELIGGIDFCTLKNAIEKLTVDSIPFHADIPSPKEWFEQKEYIQQIEQKTNAFKILKYWKQKSVANCEIIAPKITQWKTILANNSEKIEIKTIADLALKIQQYSRCQLLENEIYKKYSPIYQFKNKRKEFEKLRTSYLQQAKTVSILEREEATWKNPPTQSEVQSWEKQLTESWFTRRKITKRIQQRLQNENIDLSIALKNWKEYLEAMQEFTSLENKFLALGIERPDLEIDGIQYVLHQLDQTNPNELNEIYKIDSQTRKLIIQLGPEFIRLKQEINQYFEFEENLILEDELTIIEQHLKQLFAIQNTLVNLSPKLYQLLQKTNSTAEIEEIIYVSTWKKLENLFPALVKFNGDVLHQKLDEISAQQAHEQTQFANEIHQQQIQKFNQYHTLLRTPSNKLTLEKNAFKKQLKNGKAILVKEFSKSKQHKTIRELLSSEARIWIELLCPIWLATPTQIAQNFPMENELFEWVIFDEASQIPLPHALGALQRSKRAIVAGDEQQMSPSVYFSGQKMQVDLLHQASYYWEKIKLKHHYRSSHPSLIQFSNRYFYNDELIAYPSAWNRTQPIHWHYLPEGKYLERKNELEAEEIAKLIRKYCREKESLGIVAFSTTQLNCIWNALDASTQNELQTKIEQGNGFFRALEHVQGDECDRLIISLGYGKNAANEFHLRLGPLNQSAGVKRLNVLFSRAKETIHFVSSVKTADFQLSANEGINLLKNYIQALENQTQDEQITFPFGLTPMVLGQKLIFQNIHQTLGQVEELLTLHSVLKSRGWEITYKL